MVYWILTWRVVEGRDRWLQPGLPAGIGLYHYISMGDIKEHLAKVDKHLEKLDGNFMALDKYDHQCQSVEEDVTRKIWHGEENLEKILNDLGCEDLSGVVELNTKKGNEQYCDNNRGVSVIGTLSKVHGKILKAKVEEVGGLGPTTLLL
ncbi:uncharacterized protein [Bemisia tabaci]|uniref:uncharacterized protein n=1 Tax=Bemisia tabaci TaxID=7038 RepID=UPI003B2849C4